MLIDLHNHTPRCHHASGSPAEYAQAAFNQGIQIYGFSDHAPMAFDPQWRMRHDEMTEYEQEIRNLTESYHGKMKILLGYEVDWLPGYMDEHVIQADVDYLIGSVHFINDWGFDNPEFLSHYEGRDPDATWRDYFNLIAQMARSGLFQIVGHVDLLKVFNFLPHADIRILAQKAFKEIKKAGMAIELNSAGIRKPIGESYPSLPLLELAAELDIPITFGCDAHQTKQVGAGLEKLYELARTVGYTHALYFEGKDRVVIKI
ncbi:MAG: histidinol-phosphatase [Campylobacterales bacterium]